MATSISSLSLFILVLISGYLTLPIIENQLSDVTLSPFENVLTTERNFNSRAVFGDETATASLDDMKRSADEITGMEMTTDIPRRERMMEESSSFMGTTEESHTEKREMEPTTDSSRPERMMEESSSFMGTTEESHKVEREMEPITDIPRSERMMEESSSFMGTTEESHTEKREMEPTTDIPRSERMMEESSPFIGTTEESHTEKREMEPTTDIPRSERMMDESSSFMGTTEESHTEKREIDIPRRERMMEESSLFMLTTEESHKEEREMKDSSMMPVEQTTGSSDTIPEDKENETESHHGKRAFNLEDLPAKHTKESTVNEMRSEFTTISMPLFTATSSAVAPELYTHQSPTFSPIEGSTKKYVGSLVDSEEDTDKKDSRKDNRKPKTDKKEEEKEHDKFVDSKDKVSTDSNEDNKYAKAILYDQGTLNSAQQRPNDFAILDESIHVVTDMTNTIPSTHETVTEDNKLTQGKKSS